MRVPAVAGAARELRMRRAAGHGAEKAKHLRETIDGGLPCLLAGRREPPFYLSPGIATTAARPLSPIRSVVAGPFLAQASAAVRLVVDRSADFDLLVRPGFRHLELIESAPRDPWPAHRPALAPARARRKLFLHW